MLSLACSYMKHESVSEHTPMRSCENRIKHGKFKAEKEQAQGELDFSFAPRLLVVRKPILN